MIPLRDENPSRTVPLVTRALIVVNVIAYAYEWLLGPNVRAFLGQWAFVPVRLSDALDGRWPLPASGATILTSMFLHGSWFHLLGNMWYLWIFGDNIEDRFGHARFLLFYLASGVVAALLHFALNAGSALPTVGASGAIAGVLGAYALAYPRARVLTLVPVFFFVQVMALPAFAVLLLWFVFQFVSGALSLGGAPGGGVAWWAHIGGFAFGLGIMAIFGGPRRPSRARVDE